MVKITKTMTHKHRETLSPFVDSFVNEAAAVPLHDLPKLLESFPTRWPFPKGDMYHWVPLLNRFDTDLEAFVTRYELNKGPQVMDFGCDLLARGGATDTQLFNLGYGSEGDKEVVEKILRFSKVLLDNCGNRSIYASSPHLSDLLNSTSLSLLVATLGVGHQLAMRYQASYKRIGHGHRSVNAALLANHYNIDLDRVHQLCLPFSTTATVESSAPAAPNTPATPKGKEKGYFAPPAPAQKASTVTTYANDLALLVRDSGDKDKKPVSTSSPAKPEMDWKDWANVRISYYEAPTKEDKESAPAIPAKGSPVTPTPLRRSSTLGRSNRSATDEPEATPSRLNSFPETPKLSLPGEEQPASTLKVIDIPGTKVSDTPVHDILREYLPLVPDSSKYTLLSKLRVAKALSDSAETRRQILAVRLMAIINLAYIYSESNFIEKVLKQDGDEPRRLQLVYQLTELIHPPAEGETAIPRALQTITLLTMIALAQHSTKSQDICNALSTNVAHGVLLYTTRMAVSELATEDAGINQTEFDDWHQTLFNLIGYVLSLPRAVDELVTAGLVPSLVDILRLRTAVAERNYPTSLRILDSIVHAARNGIQSFVDAEGMDVLQNLIIHEVASASENANRGGGIPNQYRNSLIDYEIPWYQMESLRWLFKFIHHMMNHSHGQGGNFDRLLRNLMDSPTLLAAMRTVILDAKKFGAAVWTHTMFILNDFINNEPTSFAVISEAGLSRAVLESVLGHEIHETDEPKPSPLDESSASVSAQPAESSARDPPVVASARDDNFSSPVSSDTRPHPPTQQMLETSRPEQLAKNIMASGDVMAVLPDAFGALCLNNAGMKMFMESKVLESYFEIFESPAHVKILEADGGLPSALGGSFDELIRHHPPLKAAIMNATLDMVARVSHFCKKETQEKNLGAKLRRRDANGEIVLSGPALSSDQSGEANADTEMTGVAEAESGHGPASDVKSRTSMISYINVVSGFLATLLAQPSTRTVFMEKGGVEYLLDLAELPILAKSPSEERAHRNMHTVIATLADHKAHLVIPSLMKREQAAADKLLSFTRHNDNEAYFAAFVQGGVDNTAVPELSIRGSLLPEALITLTNLTAALKQCITAPSYGTSRDKQPFNTLNLADYYTRLVKSLGPILGASSKEEFKLAKIVPRSWRRSVKNAAYPPVGGADTALPTADGTREALDAIMQQNGGSASMGSVPAAGEQPVAAQSSTPTALKEDEKLRPEYQNWTDLRSLLSKVTSTVPNFLHTLGRALIGKQKLDAFQRQKNAEIADAIVETVMSQLQLKADDGERMSVSSEVFTFWDYMLGTVRDILINDARQSERPGEVITFVLQAFMRRKGFDDLNRIMDYFVKEISDNAHKVLQPNDVELLLKNDLATIGIRSILALYSTMASGKHVADSTQSNFLSKGTSDRDPGDPAYFSGGQLVVETRMAILPAVHKLWASDILEKGAKVIPSTLINIIRHILNQDFETNAFKRSQTAITKAKTKKILWKPNGDNMEMLKVFGAGTPGGEYGISLAEEALFRCNNNYTPALEYCANQRLDRSGGRNRVPGGELEPYSQPSAAQPQPHPPAAASSGTATPNPPAGSLAENQQLMQLLGSIVEGEPLSQIQPGHSHATAPPNAGEDAVLPDRWATGPKTVEDQKGEIITVDDLDEERAKLREDLADRCLEVISAHGDLTFEVADLIHAMIAKSKNQNAERDQMAELLVMALASFSSDEVAEVGKKVAAYAHLLAILLQDKQFLTAALPELKSNVPNLLSFVKLSEEHRSEDSSPWIAHILLIGEILLSEDGMPSETTWTIPKSDAVTLEKPVLKLKDYCVTTEHRDELFESILNILPRIGKDESLALAVLRILVIVTRSRKLAVAMGEKNNIQRLFVMAKQLSGTSSTRIQGPLMIILRHIVEDEETVKQIMRAEIRTFLDSQQTRGSRGTELRNFLNHLAHVVDRQPELFVEVANEMTKLKNWVNPTQENFARCGIQLQETYQPGKTGKSEASITSTTLKAAEVPSLQDVKPSTEEASTEPVEVVKPEHKPPVVENPDGVIHFLLYELVNYREVEDKGPAETATDKASPTAAGHGAQAGATGTTGSSTEDVIMAAAVKIETKKQKQEFKVDEHPIYMYRCFLLQCLTELLASYNRTKVEFIHFKRNAPAHAATPSRPRSNVVNYLLFDLIPTGCLEHAETVPQRKKAATSAWADSTLTALLSKTGEQMMDKSKDASDPDDEPDLLFVRKFVLEGVLKAYREASASTESLEMKYSRMLALADLMNHTMSGKDTLGGSDAAVAVRSQQQLKRIMFEKGFIGALTASIADIDLNFPGAKRAVKHILRPLKALTQTAIDLSELGKVVMGPGQQEEEDIESASSVSDPDEDREETPDLFRNSTLGMFGPDRENGSSSGDEDDDEEMYDEDGYDEGMDGYDEEIEDDDEPISDEEEEIEGMEGMGPIEGLDGDDAMDVEVIMEEDDDDDEDSTSNSDDDEDEDDMEDEDEDDRVEIIDEHGNAHPLEALDDEQDEWESSEGDDDEESDDAEFREHLAQVEEMRPGDDPLGARGPLGRLVQGLGGDGEGGMAGDIANIIQRMARDSNGGDPVAALDDYLGDHDEEDDEDEEDIDEDEDMDDDEEIYQEYEHPDGIMPSDLGEFEDGPGGPVLISRVQYPRRGGRFIYPGLPIFPPGPPDAHGGYDFAYRSHHRPGAAPRAADDGRNPLLQRSEANRANGGPVTPSPFMNRAQLFEVMAGGRHMPHGAHLHGPGGLLSEIFQGMPMYPLPGGPMPPMRTEIHVHGGPPSGLAAREFQAMFGSRPGAHLARSNPSDPGQATFFQPQQTIARWTEEAKLLFGVQIKYIDAAMKVSMGVFAVLAPAAFEAHKKEQARLKEAREKAEEERLAKEREEAAKREEEGRQKTLEEARQAAEAAANAPADSAAEPVTEAAAQPMERVQATGDATAATADQAPAENRPRITIPFRDGELDITDLGIDLDYLDALPEEYREEVITGAIAQRRAETAATGGQPSEIDQEFLMALPDEIRAEIMAQERQDRRRREREEQRRQNQPAALDAATPAAVQGAHIDFPQALLDVMPPSIRRRVLEGQGQDVLDALPADVLAEAHALDPEFGRVIRAFDGARPGRSAPLDSPKPPRRTIVQMLDKAGIATLIKLMFIYQQESFKNTLHQVLQNISENRHNRAEVITTILHVLQDGSADMTAVEKSFAHLSLKAKQPKDKEPKTPLTLSRKNTAIGAIISVANADISPLMVVQQCLSALIYLAKVNPAHLPVFFLHEHEPKSEGLKRSASRKGKGKENKAARFPINSLLVLLDRPLIIESSPAMESLSDLLNRLTAPLQAFERKKREAEEVARRAEQKKIEEAKTEPAAIESTDAATTERPPTPMDIDSAAPVAAEAGPSTATADIPMAEDVDNAKDAEKEKKKPKPFVPPVVPEANLRLLINIFVARECTAKTFRDTLSTIKNLSCVPEAKSVFGKELVARAQELGQVILNDLEELLPQIQKAANSTELQGVALAKFSPSSSDQNKLLRVLTALDHLFTARPKKDSDVEEPEVDREKQDLLATLYQNSTFGSMWEKLSACLTAIRQRENMLSVATILLPLIESLMVVCKNTDLKDPIAPKQMKQISLTSPVPEGRMESLFYSFTEEHRKVMNDLVRNNPKLMSGTFSLLVKNPKVLEFDNKRNFFTRNVHNRNNVQRASYPTLSMQVRRDQVFHDSFRALYFKTGDEMKYGKLSIRFHNEEGVDAGGVTREWFQALSRQMFDPNYALFVPVSSDRTTFHPNPLSGVNDEHLLFFKFIGRIIGKALYEGRVLDCHFSRAVYKCILGKPVSVKDIESMDPDYYKSVTWMLGNSIEGAIIETFSTEVDKFGAVEVIDLVPNGHNIDVTDENKQEYIRLMVEHKLIGSVKEQLDHFLKGFHEIIPAELIAIFDEQELELLISGLPEIDIDDWKANTEYHQYTAASPQVQWFWRALRSFDKEERAKMLQFVTGTSKVPLNGFKELEGMNGFSRFNIHRDYGNKDRLPTSHTCFNQLDLPEYESYEMLRQQLLTAITTGADHFGFA